MHFVFNLVFNHFKQVIHLITLCGSADIVVTCSVTELDFLCCLVLWPDKKILLAAPLFSRAGALIFP